jgi:prevent-host-death family protein
VFNQKTGNLVSVKERKPMLTVTAAETGNRLDEILETVTREPVTIHKSGNPVAVLISYEDFERYLYLESNASNEPAKQRIKPKIDLRELLSLVTSENSHPLYEIADGPRGSEVW